MILSSDNKVIVLLIICALTCCKPYTFFGGAVYENTSFSRWDVTIFLPKTSLVTWWILFTCASRYGPKQKSIWVRSLYVSLFLFVNAHAQMLVLSLLISWTNAGLTCIWQNAAVACCLINICWQSTLCIAGSYKMSAASETVNTAYAFSRMDLSRQDMLQFIISC